MKTSYVPVETLLSSRQLQRHKRDLDAVLYPKQIKFKAILTNTTFLPRLIYFFFVIFHFLKKKKTHVKTKNIQHPFAFADLRSSATNVQYNIDRLTTNSPEERTKDVRIFEHPPRSSYSTLRSSEFYIRINAIRG